MGGESGKTALVSEAAGRQSGGNGRFFGICFLCGQQGHRRAQCPSGSVNGRTGDSGGLKCYNCGKMGHGVAECREFGGKRFDGCYNCKQSGHKTWECANRVGGTNGQQTSTTGGGSSTVGGGMAMLASASGNGGFGQMVMVPVMNHDGKIMQYGMVAAPATAVMGSGQNQQQQQQQQALVSQQEPKKTEEIRFELGQEHPAPGNPLLMEMGFVHQVYEVSAICDNKEMEESDWIVDSGSTKHMRSNETDFYQLIKRDGIGKVKVGSGQLLEIKGIGEVRLSVRSETHGECEMKLLQCFWVPGLKYRLFSTKSARRNGHGVYLLPGEGYILSTTGVKILLKEQSGLDVLRVVGKIASKVAVTPDIRQEVSLVSVAESTDILYRDEDDTGGNWVTNDCKVDEGDLHLFHELNTKEGEINQNDDRFEETEGPETRVTRNIGAAVIDSLQKPPKVAEDYEADRNDGSVHDLLLSFVVLLTSMVILISKTFRQAERKQNGEKWVKAAAEELDAMRMKETRLVECVVEDFDLRSIITAKRVFTLKTNRYGRVIRVKKRLVVQGFSPIEGMDFAFKTEK